MLIIGERLNTSRKGLEEAVANRDEEFLKQIAIKQVENGAGYIDVNVGTRINTEVEDIAWLAKLVQDTVDVPLSIDTPNPKAAEAALKIHKGRAILNSISGEKKRYEDMIPLVKEYGCGVIALCMNDEGMPTNADEKFDKAQRLLDRLNSDGIKNENIYLDPLVQPISSSIDPTQQLGKDVLKALEKITTTFPDVHTSCGVSNVSFGLPKRKVLNQAFIVMCIAAGLGTAILDPNDTVLMQLILAAEALVGRDQLCANYIQAAREGKIVV